MSSDDILTAGRARGMRLEDFRYDKMQDAFWVVEDGILLKDRAVDSSIHAFEWPADDEGNAIRPSAYIRSFGNGLVVDGAVWWPGKPKIIEGFSVTAAGALKPNPRAKLVNLYAPAVELP